LQSRLESQLVGVTSCLSPKVFHSFFLLLLGHRFEILVGACATEGAIATITHSEKALKAPLFFFASFTLSSFFFTTHELQGAGSARGPLSFFTNRFI